MPPVSRKPSPAPEPVGDDTPIHDQLKTDLANADPADVTLFEEDDDPTANAGDFVDDEDDTEEKN